jgi:hypothetical protein
MNLLLIPLNVLALLLNAVNVMHVSWIVPSIIAVCQHLLPFSSLPIMVMSIKTCLLLWLNSLQHCLLCLHLFNVVAVVVEVEVEVMVKVRVVVFHLLIFLMIPLLRL